MSTEGVAQIFVQFQLEKNVDVAAQEVRDKVNQILADLPADIDPPIVDKVDPDAAPVLFSRWPPSGRSARSGSRTRRCAASWSRWPGWACWCWAASPARINLWLDRPVSAPTT